MRPSPVLLDCWCRARAQGSGHPLNCGTESCLQCITSSDTNPVARYRIKYTKVIFVEVEEPMKLRWPAVGGVEAHGLRYTLHSYPDSQGMDTTQSDGGGLSWEVWPPPGQRSKNRF